jgi:hypothetical protein
MAVALGRTALPTESTRRTGQGVAGSWQPVWYWHGQALALAWDGTYLDADAARWPWDGRVRGARCAGAGEGCKGPEGCYHHEQGSDGQAQTQGTRQSTWCSGSFEVLSQEGKAEMDENGQRLDFIELMAQRPGICAWGGCRLSTPGLC